MSAVEGGAGTPTARTATSGAAGPAGASGPGGAPAGAFTVPPAHVRLAWRARRAAFGTLLGSTSGAAGCLALLRGRR